MNARSRHTGAVHISAPSFPTAPRPSLYRKIAYTFLGLTVIIVLAVLWLTSVKAEVVVKVSRQTVSLDGTVGVAKEPGIGQIPGRVLQGTYERIQEFQVTGEAGVVAAEEPEEERLPDSQVRARGRVKVINNYSKTQPLVRVTRLLAADGRLYRIDRDISVPPGGEVEVEAYADQTGYAFEFSGEERFTIPGLYDPLEEFIYAVSVTPFAAVPIDGEEIVEVETPAAPAGPRVTQADVDRAEKELMDIVLSRAKSELANEAGNPDLEVVYVVKVAEKRNSVAVGEAATSFISSLKLDVPAVYYSREDMQALIRERLKERVPEGREFLPFEGSSVSYSLESADPQTEKAEIRVTAEAGYRLSAEHPSLQPSALTGKTREEAESMIRGLDGVEDVEITLRPNWLNKIPSLKDKVTVMVQ
jgi:hypothetical protein